MKKISANTLLKDSIKQMEIKRYQELILLKAQAYEVGDSFKPINLVKNTFFAITDSSNLKMGITKTVIGVASGLLFRKMLFRIASKPIRKVAGVLIQTAVLGLIANHPNKANTLSLKVLNAVFAKFRYK